MATLLKTSSRGDDVKELQSFLKNNGLYSGAIDGIYGPKTMNGVLQFQTSNGLKVDGIVGPQTWGAINSRQTTNDNLHNTLSDPNVANAVANDPIASDILNRMINNDFNGITDAYGRPYDANMVQSMFNASERELAPAYEEEQRKATNDIESQLGLAQRDYDRYLSGAQAGFQNDKGQLDTSAAKNGVLFSTSRAQDQNQLQSKYEADQAAQRDKYSSAISDAARDYNYKFGADPTRSLNNYFKLNTGNVYDANKARDNVSSGGLSSVYSANSGYYGTQPRKKKYESALRTADKLGYYTNNRTTNPLNTQLP